MTNLAFKVQPRLDGVFSWLFQKKQARYPAPIEHPRRSMFQVFAPKTQELEPPAEKKISIFERFAPKGEPGLPAVRPEMPVEVHERPSAFSVFAPEAPGIKPQAFAAFDPEVPGPIETFKPKTFEVFEPGRPSGPLTKVLEKPFEVFKPSPEEEAAAAESFEAREARQMEMWEGLFPEAAEAEEKDIFEAFKPEEVADSDELRESYGRQYNQLGVLPLPPRDQLLPTPEDVARGFLTAYGENIWDEILNTQHDPNWVVEMWEYAHRSMIETENEEESYETEPHIPWIEIDTITTFTMASVSFDVALCLYFGIPQEWISSIVREHGGVPEDWDQGEDGIVRELVVDPLRDVFFEAMKLIKPDWLPGDISIQFEDHEDFQPDWKIVYWDGDLYEQYKTMEFPPGSWEDYKAKAAALQRGRVEEEREEAPKPKPKKKPKSKKKKKGKS